MHTAATTKTYGFLGFVVPVVGFSLACAARLLQLFPLILEVLTVGNISSGLLNRRRRFRVCGGRTHGVIATETQTHTAT